MTSKEINEEHIGWITKFTKTQLPERNQQFSDSDEVNKLLDLITGKENSDPDVSVKKSDTETTILGNENFVIGLIIGLVFLAFTLVVTISIGIKRYHKKKNELERSGKKLLEGKPTEINRIIHEQVEYLPYDKRWEFPKNRLKMGIQLGEGFFGRVVKAEAVGIKGATETVKTVAVKMVKSENASALEALIRELKILIFLGLHLNVVNLLGACTKGISKGELWVIVEYCPYGNLQTYLVNHRDKFINQLDEQGNMITDHQLDRTDMTIRSSARGNLTETTDTYVSLIAESSPENAECLGLITPEDTHDDNYISFWQYQQDPEFVLTQSMTTRDLMCWSFQIARGMDYLASKKVFHGDLAARNILLADHGVVKVADFGNSQQLYNGKYEMTTERKLPVKWMAIETLTDRILSSQSDVWSYGVLLWEIFSLGKVPYPGETIDHQFIRRLQNGYRMDKPDFAPNGFGEIMVNCWKKDPNERPTFNQLEDMIRTQLELAVCTYYINLNNEYEKLNEEKANYPPNAKLANIGLAKLLDVDANFGTRTLPTKSSSCRRPRKETNKHQPKRTKSLQETSDRQASMRLGNTYV